MRLAQRNALFLPGLTLHTRLHVVQLLNEHPGLRITSGRRSRARNRWVGGVPNSFHLRGRAIDVTGSRAELAAAASTAWAQRVGPSCTGPEEVIDEGDHLHIAW
jgi:uncharacterized protein YcbK (DUF882 family)